MCRPVSCQLCKSSQCRTCTSNLPENIYVPDLLVAKCGAPIYVEAIDLDENRVIVDFLLQVREKLLRCVWYVNCKGGSPEFPPFGGDVINCICSVLCLKAVGGRMTDKMS